MWIVLSWQSPAGSVRPACLPSIITSTRWPSFLVLLPDARRWVSPVLATLIVCSLIVATSLLWSLYYPGSSARARSSRKS
jgi:hypothetical protein